MGARVITVTSGKGGVGKTTATANFAVALAGLNKKVVCIDADIGLRNLDVVMGLENRIVYDLVDVVESVVPIVAEHYPDGRVRVDPGDQPGEVVTDGNVVARVATALIDNAVKYTATGTQVRVTITGTDDGAEIAIADACGGLPESDLRRLFQRSFRGDHGADGGSGLGLGLYIAHRLTEHVGGRLDARNAGDGCIFTLWLPATLEDRG